MARDTPTKITSVECLFITPDIHILSIRIVIMVGEIKGPQIVQLWFIIPLSPPLFFRQGTRLYTWRARMVMLRALKFCCWAELILTAKTM